MHFNIISRHAIVGRRQYGKKWVFKIHSILLFFRITIFQKKSNTEGSMQRIIPACNSEPK